MMPTSNIPGFDAEYVVNKWRMELNKWNTSTKKGSDTHKYSPANTKYVPLFLFKNFISKFIDLDETELDSIIYSSGVMPQYTEILGTIHKIIDDLPSPARLMLHAMLGGGPFGLDDDVLRKDAAAAEADRAKKQKEKDARGKKKPWSPFAFIDYNVKIAQPAFRRRGAIERAQRYAEDMTPVLERLIDWLKKTGLPDVGGLDKHALSYIEIQYAEDLKQNFIELMRTLVKESEADNSGAISVKRAEELIDELYNIRKYDLAAKASSAEEYIRLRVRKSETEAGNNLKNFVELSQSYKFSNSPNDVREAQLNILLSKLDHSLGTMANNGREEAAEKIIRILVRVFTQAPVTGEYRARWLKIIAASAKSLVPGELTGINRKKKEDSTSLTKVGEDLMKLFTANMNERWAVGTKRTLDGIEFEMRGVVWANLETGRIASAVQAMRLLEAELQLKEAQVRRHLRGTSEQDVLALIDAMGTVQISVQARAAWTSLFKYRLSELEPGALDGGAVSESYTFAIIKAAIETQQYGRRKRV